MSSSPTDQPQNTDLYDDDEFEKLLRALADKYRIANTYYGSDGHLRQVSLSTIRKVLASFGVVVESTDDIRAGLEDHELKPWRRMLPPVIVTTAGNDWWLPVHVPDGDPVSCTIALESGDTAYPTQLDVYTTPRLIDGQMVGRAMFAIPTNLPHGWHQLTATSQDTVSSCPLVVTPQHAPGLPSHHSHHLWGILAQLYSTRSQHSWGIGDLGDLADLAAISGSSGADFLSINPLHASSPLSPQEDSPYLPTTRRFVNPIYLDIEAIPETLRLKKTQQKLLKHLASDLQAKNTTSENLVRSTTYDAKLEILREIFKVPRRVYREESFRRFCEQEGDGLHQYALWSVIYEELGDNPKKWSRWAPHANTEWVRKIEAKRSKRIQFHKWLQWQLDEQLDNAQQQARRSGMSIGITHDLAVGVTRQGADTWVLGDAFAQGMTVGAPPDPYNQLGQNWNQPPWNPEALADLAYIPFRDMVRTVLRHAGALRVDHILGLFRLWWIPDSAGATEGTYVNYDHEALLGILALEAEKANAVIIGEDMGTYEPWMREYLAQRGIFGTSVLWFEYGYDGHIKPPEDIRASCLATVTTHDMPPTGAYLAGKQVALREQLNLLSRPVEEERAAADSEINEMLVLAHQRGYLAESELTPPHGSFVEVEALYRLLADTPARLQGISLTDAVGEKRSQNVPGTHLEYPNWCLPLCDSTGTPVLLEELSATKQFLATIAALKDT